jgi:hypothetical protein
MGEGSKWPNSVCSWAPLAQMGGTQGESEKFLIIFAIKPDFYSSDQGFSGYPHCEMWRNLISAFIIFNIVAIASGSSLPLAQQNPVQRFFSPYLVWTRLLQSWQLFVPSPRTYLINYRAEIKFKDGSVKTWKRPYPPNWDFFPRHLSYNFQKWDLAANYLEKPRLAPLLWTDLAHYLVREYADDNNPPETISFFRSRVDLPPPNETGYVQPDLTHLRWSDQILYTYSVKLGTLQ